MEEKSTKRRHTRQPKLKNQFHFNFMQIILTKSNKMKLLKQIGHLRLLNVCVYSS